MKIVTILSAAAICLGGVVQASAQTAPMAAEFATKASVGNTFEVEESKLALAQASSPKVQAFARMMIADHSKAEKTLQAAAKGAGSSVEMALDAPHQSMVDALKGKSGADFDKAYVGDQVQAHQETAALLSAYQQGGDNPKLKTWAKQTLPKVNAHLKRVQALSSM
jgi:putative membrane protein